MVADQANANEGASPADDIKKQNPEGTTSGEATGEVSPHADDVLPSEAKRTPPEEHEAEKTGDFA